MCNLADKTDLVSYLYDDLDGGARATFERHLRGCDECRDELGGMRAVRADLLAWTPPEPQFAFRIVAEPREGSGDVPRQGAANILRPSVASWRRWFTPAAAFAAAAVLVLAAAAGLARIEVRRSTDGWTLRTGSSYDASLDAARVVSASAAHDVYLPADDGAFAALERRIGALESASHDSNVRNASYVSARSNDEEILRVVRELLSQSETRQKGELALRIAQVIRDVDAQRTADLTNLQKGIGRIDANVADEAAAHRELMNYLLTSNSKMK
jgi:anti-sigma factor RsiW